uniref:Phosphoglucomutase/phosphomannomutase (Pmm-pgm) n=1 Tax=uncultured marine thaumarchaeote AD1000_05_B01 TaxID=1455883 RepID=A0A075FLT7_9ARCH|nr:phosphoglucomutase/phosphomannomutase (pmm-pgm) [uncultured marine thaumarchaeote AD1000_05_B01]
MIVETVKAQLMEVGIDVYDLGMAPTPVVFRESRKYGAGIIVTSSHNPIEWNGLKMIIDGRGINAEQLDTVMKEQNTSKSEIGMEYKIKSSYIDDASKIIGKISDAPAVTVDIGGGAAKGFSSELLEKVGCNVITINDEREKSSRGPDPTTDALKDLIANAKERDIGFAFDLDGDRLVIVINGEKKNPDVTLGIGVVKALELGCKNFVLSQDTSISVEKYIKQNGGMVYRSKVGEANVAAKMVETKSQVGGEGSSGGFILSDFNYCRDGILTSGLIASIIKTDEFANAINFMEKYHIIRDKVEYDSEHHDDIMKVLYDKMKEKFGNMETLDGLKAIIDDDSWALIRKSNTENVIRISAESNSLEKVRNIHQEIKDLIKESYEQIK